MLDISKPVGSVEGLTLYRDHENDKRIYFFPDEIGLAAPDGSPDLQLQVFYPDDAVPEDQNLTMAVGSIFTIGVRCIVSPGRLTRAQQQLGDNVELVLPPWEDGTVQLLLLDAADSRDPSTGSGRMSDDPLVLSVVGTRRPSLSDRTLSALFHARLDRRGTALVAAALSGTAGSNTGVMYDLTFAALRPEVQLRMSANLDSCAEAFSGGVGAQIYYVAADVEATFATLREKGTINVELMTLADDAETKRLVDEAVHDFYDTLMRELFRPALAPADAAGMTPRAPTVSSAPVRLRFAYSRGDRERIVQVDYRKRSGVRRVHNPSAHLRALGSLGDAARLVQRIPLSAGWRESRVEIAAPLAFDADTGLLSIEPVIWRGRDPILPAERARGGGLRMPATAVPLADFAFTRDDSEPRRRAWVSDPADPPSYHWQSKFTFEPRDDVDSPDEIWTEPQTSTSADLDLFPSVLAPVRRIELIMGAGHDDTLVDVEADITAHTAANHADIRRRLVLRPGDPRKRWSIRRGHGQPVALSAVLTYRYTQGRQVRLSAQEVLDPEIIVNTPFATTADLTPQVIGPTVGLAKIVLSARVDDEPTGYHSENRVDLQPPEFAAGPLQVPLLHRGDNVHWIAVGWDSGGSPARTLASGSSPGGVVEIPASSDRRIRVEWVGSDLVDEELRWVRVTVHSIGADGSTTGTAVVQWDDRHPTTPQQVTVPRGDRIEFRVERRGSTGVQADAWQTVSGEVIAVTP
jgi:hypothetical protein